jgi:hypothetical protein
VDYRPFRARSGAEDPGKFMNNVGQIFFTNVFCWAYSLQSWMKDGRISFYFFGRCPSLCISALSGRAPKHDGRVVFGIHHEFEYFPGDKRVA